MNPPDLFAVLLLALLGFSLSTGVTMVILLKRRGHWRPLPMTPPSRAFEERPFSVSNHGNAFVVRPTSWLAIKSRNLAAVQSALGLHNAKSCSWVEGLACNDKLFIAPPVRGWILVFGSGLPDPADDVDQCFRFLAALSHRLGHLQFFSASRILHHHSWVRMETGRVIRAYAWSGRTQWQQGPGTAAEAELGLTCLPYGDWLERSSFGLPDGVVSNVDKVPLLAARWSLDPAGIEEQFMAHERGIAGEPSRRY
jgi:hypothetical protein